MLHVILLFKISSRRDYADSYVDGGGIRGYSALLILQELMRVIGRIEEAYKPGPSGADEPAKSSYHPLSPSLCAATDSRPPHCQNESSHPRTESSPWLPCHYFDYIAGTSTGGYSVSSLRQEKEWLIPSQINWHHAWTFTNEHRRLHHGI